MQDIVFAHSMAKGDDPNEDIYDLSSSRLVLCDGASESFDSCTWAKILARNYINHEQINARMLAESIKDYDTAQAHRELNWAQQLASGRGSYSTLLGYFYSSRDNSIWLDCVGDSSAFVIRDSDLAMLFSYPYRRPEEYLDRPRLLSTQQEKNVPLNASLSTPPWLSTRFALRHKVKYHVLLLTDAIACWLLKNRDNAQSVACLLNLTDNDHNIFEDFVAEKRKSGEMKTDDTTMIHVTITA